MPDDKEQDQLDRFKQAARDLECDPDEKRWDDHLAKVAKAKSKRDQSAEK